MKIFLVRHGETNENKYGIMQGHLDSTLNEWGMLQAERIAEKLKEENICAIYCSDLQRAYHTAEIIRKKAFPQSPCYKLHDLRELSIGELEGKKWEKIKDISREEFLKIIQNNGGESIEHFKTRVWNSFIDIIKKHNNGETVLIVTHGGSIKVILQNILKAENLFDKLVVSNGSITRIIAKKLSNGELRFQLEQLNDTSHLEI